MATVTGLTKERMEAIEAASIVDGEVVAGNLILTRFDATTINAGSVIGPTGSPGLTLAEMNALLPAGVILDYAGTAAPNANWLTMTGQTIVGGNVTYPNLWAVIPATWKSGSNIVFPDTRGRVAVGYNSSDTDFDVIGETGGAKTVALVEANLASHVHSGPSHVHAGPNHQHTMSHGHAHSGSSGGAGGHSHSVSGNTNGDGAHDHFYDGFIGAGHQTILTRTEGTGGNALQVIAGSDLLSWVGQPGSVGETHAHAFSASSVSNPGDHTHTISVSVTDFTGSTVAAGTGDTGGNTAANTGSAGSGTAHNNLQPYVVFLKIIKAV